MSFLTQTSDIRVSSSTHCDNWNLASPQNHPHIKVQIICNHKMSAIFVQQNNQREEEEVVGVQSDTDHSEVTEGPEGTEEVWKGSPPKFRDSFDFGAPSKIKIQQSPQESPRNTTEILNGVSRSRIPVPSPDPLSMQLQELSLDSPAEEGNGTRGLTSQEEAEKYRTFRKDATPGSASVSESTKWSLVCFVSAFSSS